MASIQKDKRNGNWTVSFRYGGKQWMRSCKTTEEVAAKRIKAKVEDTIALLDRGMVELPDDADPATWIMSGGKRSHKPNLNRTSSPMTFEKIVELYFESSPDGAKEEGSIKTERTHTRRFQEFLSADQPLKSLDFDTMQRYVTKRSQDKGIRGKVKPQTIKKEIQTFRQVWEWAAIRNHVDGICPILNKHGKVAIVYPKGNEKPPFKSWDEIEKIVKRGGLSEIEVKELWDCLWLSDDEIVELLDFVKKTASHPFIYPMFVLAAYTGARRSELCRSRIEDISFNGGLVTLREKKRRKTVSISFRHVPLHNSLRQILEGWFEKHPGGPFTIAVPKEMPRGRKTEDFQEMSADQAHDHFSRTLADSKWEVLRGWHVLRHSFASNLARKGVDQRYIDTWMGHQTEEMRRRYQHLRPQDKQAEIDSLAPAIFDSYFRGRSEPPPTSL